MRAIARVLCPCLLALWTLTAAAYACPIKSKDASEEQQLLELMGSMAKHQEREFALARYRAEDTRRSGSAVAVMVLVATLLGSLVVVAGPAADARRSRARRRRTPTPLDAGLVAKLARRSRGRAIIHAIIAMAAAYAVVATMQEPAPHLFLLVGPLVVFVRALAIAIRAQLVLRHVRDPEITTRYDGSRFIFVLHGDELAGWLVAFPSTLAREVARGMPTATVLN